MKARRIAIALITVGLLASLAAIRGSHPAEAAGTKRPPIRWLSTEVSWYGPGFYGNGMACGGRLTTRTRGFAHRTLPCGSVIQVCHRRIYRPRVRRCVVERIIDRGPYVRGRDLDATAKTAQILTGRWRPYTMKRKTIQWRVIRRA